MSDFCHVCGPVKHEAPTVICAQCALQHAEEERIARIHEQERLAVESGWVELE